jgi:hypothetical protein
MVEGTIILSPKSNPTSPPLEKSILKVQGRVLNEKGEPLEGVSIAVKGTAQTIMSDQEGAFTITVPNEDAVLVFSFVGYKTVEVPVKDNSNILLRLQLDIQRLSDVVSIGYGSIETCSWTYSA